MVQHLVRPVGRAGLYAPGGRARYPSTVLMCAAPARVAGVAELVLCVPPGPDGAIAAETLAAAAIAGIDEVYRVGGAQAVAAMAFGTESIAPVDVIVGPGNRYVAEAKRQVSGIVGVPSAFAGPSEVVVVADDDTPVAWAAIDVVVQAEHGPDGLAWLVTWSPEAADAIEAEVDRLVAASPRRADLEATLGTGGYVALVDGPAQAVAVANVVAPEHLELLVDGAAGLAPVGALRRGGLPGPVCPGQRGRLPGGPEPRAAHGPHGALRVGAAGRRLPHPHPRRVDGRRRPWPDSHRTSSPSPRPRGSRRTPDPWSCGASRDGGPRPAAARPDGVVGLPLPPGRGGGPPQHQRVAVAAPAGVARRVARRARLASTSTAIPTADATELRAALAEFHGVDPARVFCANGSNEVLQCLLLAYGGPGRVVALFEPTYALHSHIASLTATEVVRGWRGPDHRVDLDVVDRVLDESQPVVTFLCSPNNPTGRAEPPEVVAHVLDARPGAGGGGRGLRAVRPVERPRPRHGGAPRERRGWSWCAPSPRRGRWRRVASATSSPIPAVVAACEAVVLPYHLDAMTQAAGRLALRHVDAMEARVALITEERGRLAAALGELAVESWPSDANFILFRPTGRMATDVWQDLLDASVLVRDCSSVAGPRQLPPRHGGHARGERPVPGRPALEPGVRRPLRGGRRPSRGGAASAVG